VSIRITGRVWASTWAGLLRILRVLKQLGPLVVVRGEGVIPEGMTGAVSSLVSSSNLFGDKHVTS